MKFPGLASQVNKVFNQVGQGITPGPSDQVQVRPWTFWHRQDISDPDSSLTFFNATRAPHVTNWPSNSGLGSNQAFWLTGASITMEYGWNTAGTAVAANIGQTVAGATQVLTMEFIRGLLQGGNNKLSVGGQEVFDVYGCQNFPSGGGPVADIKFADSDQAAGIMTLMMGNGMAVNTNIWEQTPWYPILPQKEVRWEIDWAHPTDGPGAVVARVELRGLLVSTGFKW